jgi:RNA ligase (TIGR02306 family)
MSEIIRKLASVETISRIVPHPNADSLEIAEVKGWNCIVKKDQHKAGELIAYFEVDAFLPVMPQFEFLRKACFKSTANLGDGFRIKTIKLRGQLSQGLVLPLSDFRFEFPVEEGTDLTEVLGVQKYERPIPSNLQGRVKGNFPIFIPKTDQERIQNLHRKQIHARQYDTFEQTIKLDGSSMTVYYNNGDFGVCSRNFDLEETEDNTFWIVANALDMKRIEIFKRNIALQGEMVGPGINHNRANLTEHDFYLFDIYDIDQRRHLMPSERHYVFEHLLSLGMKIKHIPVVNRFAGFPTNEVALQFANDTTFNHLPAEGIVYKSNDADFSFKVISNNYLLRHDE